VYVLFSAFFLIVAVTGIVLNHRGFSSGYRLSDLPSSPANIQYGSHAAPGFGPGGPGPGGSFGAGNQMPAFRSNTGWNSWKTLHTGRFWGLPTIVCDLTALALIVTVLTGLCLYVSGLNRKFKL
ncbi:MAG: PepSY domain-containing protein, partial [Firmicutes bacterium]|nr:PepSY domain-containing protein [Bacillota bacterium]